MQKSCKVKDVCVNIKPLYGSENVKKAVKNVKVSVTFISLIEILQKKLYATSLS